MLVQQHHHVLYYNLLMNLLLHLLVNLLVQLLVHYVVGYNGLYQSLSGHSGSYVYLFLPIFFRNINQFILYLL